MNMLSFVTRPRLATGSLLAAVAALTTIFAPLPARAAAVSEPESVTLGDPSLTAGVPGTGPITTAQIEAWLAIVISLLMPCFGFKRLFLWTNYTAAQQFRPRLGHREAAGKLIVLELP